MKNYDVLVIGAGPAGSRVADRLSGFGYSVAVLERHGSVGEHVCCTGIISRECARHFDITDGCILREANSAKLYAPSGDVLMLRTDEPQACVVDRVAFDGVLAERARCRGVEYLLSSNVSNIAVADHCVEAQASQGDEVVTIRGKAAVIANGSASRLAGKLGMGAISDVIVGAQAEVEAPGIAEIEVYFGQQKAPGFFAWIVPVSQRKALVGLLSRKKPGTYLRGFLSELALQGRIANDEASIAYGAVPLTPLSRTFDERVLVLGDAAGQVKPTTGGGVYFGLLCADMAAETIHQAFAADDLSRKRLSRYEKAWRSKLGRELRIGYALRRLYERMSDRRIDGAFRVAKEHGIDQALLESEHLSFDWHGDLMLQGLRHFVPWRHLLGKRVPGALLKFMAG